MKDKELLSSRTFQKLEKDVRKLHFTESEEKAFAEMEKQLANFELSLFDSDLDFLLQ